MNHLDVLVQHRDNLLLAEAVGWLHDYRKCSDQHLEAQAPNGKPALPRSALKRKYPCIDKVELPLFSLTVTHLLNDKIRDNDLIGRYLSRCHETAHFDKQKPVDGEQEYPGTKLSTPFGFEKDIPTKLTEALWALPWNDLCSYNLLVRENLRKEISNLFSKAVADTRRPINEVDLWSWGLLVGALYKAALAGALLTGSKPEPEDLHWRLLGVRVDGLGYLLNVVRIPDLLARKELLTDGLNKVRELLEVTYPLGSEVYRDENGSIFVVPDVSDLLQRTESSGLDLETLILQAFARGAVKNKSNLQLDKEIMPHLELESQPWWGQDPKWPEFHEDKLPDIIGLLTRKITSAADAERVGKYWQGGQVTDICTVCGLRPQGPGKKAADRNVCDICEERRADRSQQWVTSQMDRTIWTDEVADANGRLALILGQFDLMHWLDGSMLQTLLLIAPKNNEEKEPGSKAPSFSRLRRIWETTRTFWEEVQTESLECLKDDRRLLKIYFKGALNLAPYHVYDLVIGPTDLSVVWVPSQDSQPGYLLSADNLGYIARQLGAEPDTYTQPAKAAAFVEDYLVARFVKNAQQPILLNPDTSAAWESINLTKGTFIDKVVHQDDCYATFIPILAEPRSFMALVPADKALHIVKYIKGKYESEMGKVRNRLPLHLGCVYASRRTPIRAVLDAGRAMLDHRARPEKRVVIVENREENELTLTLERNGHRIQWHIPLKMGDGKTEDSWYPYFFLDTEGDDSEVGENNRRTLKVSCPTEEGQMRDCQIVHAADLRTGETTYIWPSTFDFEYLDITARRFDIYYDEDGRRPRRTRPFYLEDLGRLEELWGYMKRLTKTQRQQVIRTIEATRETWYGQDQQGRSVEDDVFKQFVTDTLAGAAWPEGQPWGKIPEEWRDKLIQAGVCGELTDLAELHMKIKNKEVKMTAYKRRRYLLMTTDPVHIGTGGYRLGRVDNSIVREPGTRVPKIPGTSLHGAIRSYAARLYGTPEAAGQSHDKVEKPEENPVCYTFGYTKKEKKGDDEKTTAYSGVVNIFDAHVLLFPVPSMVGPVWVSTLRRLKEAGFSIQKDGIEVLEEPKQGDVLLTWERDESLNLGWLMVNVAGKVTVAAPKEWEETERWKAVCERLVLVGESLFSHIVNSNLEVRTSVAIDPKQGAAEEGALFTYEAIPRATFLTAEIVLDDYRNNFPRKQTVGKWKDPLCVVDAGLQLIEWLGIGGMGTRGFGRMAIVGNPIDEEYHNN